MSFVSSFSLTKDRDAASFFMKNDSDAWTKKEGKVRGVATNKRKITTLSMTAATKRTPTGYKQQLLTVAGSHT
ncbi:hypothetical protein PRIPAC_73037 [Pristionchus pacificus]|uniref:Uncharacterized protein n=1 Tax=Pristionchus pacificus TaxID=54126 RepID=A0A2A6C1A5_PRIPA|nr:hypothetical protein PRIPAC_73037 [Pristionchus pacificus]|eukprot:PDM71889.1 hypothetical protein PRIPAC_38296 [Pristionchus pacificus]